MLIYQILQINISGIWYTIACLESTRNNKQKAIESLKKAVELEKKRKDYAKKDIYSFELIRDTKEFKELIG